MVEFVNYITGTQMWVADDRVEEYKEAGHKLASSNSDTEGKPTEPKKRSTKKK